MLKLKNLFENFDLAREVLRLYDADETCLDSYLRYFRVSSNAIYPFRSAVSGKTCFLRLSPEEEKPLADVISEICLIRWLIDQGYPAMVPHAMADGRLWACLDTPWGRYNVSCFEAVPGETLEDAEGSPALVKGYGRTLGRLHTLMKRYPHGEDRRDHKALLDEIGQRLNTFGAPECVLRELAAVKEALAALPDDASCYGVVHYDFEPDNVLYDETSGEFGVIDFDDAIRCWYALDVVRALDALNDVADMDGEEAAALFLSGYREAADFTEEQERTLPLMRRLVHLQAYATHLYVMADPVPDEPDWMTEIRERLTGEQRRLEQEMPAAD